MLVRMWRKGIFKHSWWVCKLGQLLWKFLKIKKIWHDLAIPILGIYPKESKSIYKRDT
jgi:hypothetical protein